MNSFVHAFIEHYVPVILTSLYFCQLFNDSLITKPLVDADFEQQCGLDLEQGREPEDEVSSVNMTTDEPSIEQNRQQQQSTLEPPSLTLDESNTSQLPAPEPSIVPEAPSLHDDTLVNQRVGHSQFRLLLIAWFAPHYNKIVTSQKEKSQHYLFNVICTIGLCTPVVLNNIFLSNPIFDFPKKTPRSF